MSNPFDPFDADPPMRDTSEHAALVCRITLGGALLFSAATIAALVFVALAVTDATAYSRLTAFGFLLSEAAAATLLWVIHTLICPSH